MSTKVSSNRLLNDRVHRLYLHYLFPTLIAMASNSLYCLADVFFISKGAGSTGLAALNIAMPLFTLYSAIGLTFGVGGATIMSIAEGTGHMQERNQAFTCSVLGMSVIGLFIAVFGTIFAQPFAYMLGSSQELLPHVMEYMRPINACAMFFVINYAGSILLRNDHAPKLAMQATLCGNITNIILDYLLVMVFGMGLFGASIATALSAVLSLLFMLPHFFFKQNTVHFCKDIFSIEVWKRMLMNGAGSGVLEISAGSVVLIFNYVIVQEADQLFLAAYAIVTNIAYVTKGLLNGFAQAAQPIISTNYGARQKKRTQQAFHISLIASSLFALLLYVLFLLFPNTVAAIFSDGDMQLIASAGDGIRFYFTSLFFTAIITMILYYLQAIECSRAATILALLKGFVFVIISLFIMVHLFGMNGIWFTITLAEGLAVLSGFWLLKKL